MKPIMWKSLIVIALGIMCVSTSVFALVDNPILKNVRTADPAPLVYNGRFYIVCGQDEVNTNAFNMYSWRLMSSADMNTWTDHGVILRPSDISWIPNNRAWASQIVYRNGYFYFYASGDQMIGVLRATSITGPYVDVNGRPLLTQNDPGAPQMTIDPTVFVDSDGRAFLWYGLGKCRYVELNSDMISLKGTPTDITAGLNYYLEAPYVIKEGSTYFLIYADNPWPSRIRYATSTSITGPWTYRGIIGERTGTGTNHAGAALFNGQWYYVYHTEELSNGNPYSRCVCVDRMTISGTTISPIAYTSFWMGGSTPAPTPVRTATPAPGGTYYKIRNRATGLCIDGMGLTSNGSNAGQSSSNTSYNQQWVIETAGSYYKIKNRTTGLYLDGMGRTSNGSICGQWSSSSSYNQQWQRVTVGSYVKYRNRATGLYLDGMGSTTNGANVCQWSSSSSYNQQWQIVSP